MVYTGIKGLIRKKVNLIIKCINEKIVLDETTLKKYKDKQTTLISELLSSTKGIAFEGELKGWTFTCLQMRQNGRKYFHLIHSRWEKALKQMKDEGYREWNFPWIVS